MTSRIKLDPSLDPDRYWFQPWYVKLWRWRHVLMVPFRVLRNGPTAFVDYSWRNRWSLERGDADVRMGRVYSCNEIRSAE